MLKFSFPTSPVAPLLLRPVKANYSPSISINQRATRTDFYFAVGAFCRIFRYDAFLARRSGYDLYFAFLFNSPRASSSSHRSDVRVDTVTYLTLVVQTMVQVERLRQKVAEQPSPGLILSVRVYAVE